MSALGQRKNHTVKAISEVGKFSGIARNIISSLAQLWSCGNCYSQKRHNNKVLPFAVRRSDNYGPPYSFKWIYT